MSQQYAEALEANRLDDAFAISAGLERQAFFDRYADAARRMARATQLRSAAEGAGGDVQLLLEAGGWKVLELHPAAASFQTRAREVLGALIDATEKKDFERALTLLGASWRGRYTAKRLEDDFTREPLAKERLSRAKAALDGAWVVAGESIELPIGAGKAVRLIKEGSELKVAALE